MEESKIDRYLRDGWISPECAQAWRAARAAYALAVESGDYEAYRAAIRVALGYHDGGNAVSDLLQIEYNLVHICDPAQLLSLKQKYAGEPTGKAAALELYMREVHMKGAL